MPKILLVGNPNCGKTTLFNSLTGDRQRVGNWAGVTVEKKTGVCLIDKEPFQVIDLPGVYSLSVTKSSTEDAKITAKEVVADEVDVIINVVDACHLERHLYLSTQLLELNKPMIIVINMLDIAKSRKISINTDLLAKKLQCPVISTEAHKNIGILELKKVIASYQGIKKNCKVNYSEVLQTKIDSIKNNLLEDKLQKKNLVDYYARRLLEGAEFNDLSLKKVVIEDEDILMADERYSLVHDLVANVQTKASDFKDNITAKIDKVILHRFFALPIFIAIMYLMFSLVVKVGSALQGFFDITTQTIFVGGTTYLLNLISAPNWLIGVVANGIGRGINTTATFIPVIAMMFFLLSLLETSGYMARAAFVIDRLMRILGLPGKAFVPMLVGFGCNVPGIMAARTLDSERDRILTILMSPFMSCSARLAIYAVFVTAFFPSGGQNIVFSLYLIGIAVAVLTGFLLRKTIVYGQPSSLIIELPAYHKPSLGRLLKETSFRLRHFLFRAGKLIIPICVLLNFLDTLVIDTELGELSILACLGQWLMPIFSPMGMDAANWPAVVGLLTGTLAKEVVIGSLNSLYAQVGNITDLTMTTDFNFMHDIGLAFNNLFTNICNLGQSFLHPFAKNINNSSLHESVYGVMYQYFSSKAAVYAYLLFILLYIPCVSTMAVIRQETNVKLMWLSIIWSLLIAYAVAVIFYQTATFLEHMQQSMIWLSSIMLSISLMLFITFFVVSKRGGNVISTT